MKKNIIYLANYVCAVMAVLCMSVIISCDSRERLYIYNWTYYTPDSIIEKFEEEYDVRIVYDEFASNEDMYAKLRATQGKRSGYDVVFPSKDYVPIMMRQGMLERIDHSKMINLKNIDTEVLEIASYDPQMEYSVPYFYGAAGIIINTARVPNFERSWSIFSREDLKGRMTMLDDMREVLGGALSFLGYSVNEVNPALVALARDHINNSWKPNLVKFDSEAFGKGYANGDFWVVHAFPEAVYEEIADNAQLMADTVFFIPREGGPSYIDNMVILKGARNIDMAHKFIDFIHRPEIYAEFADAFALPATVNVPARQYKKVKPFYSEADLKYTELVEDLVESLQLYTDTWFNSIRVGE
ncbi:MAG: extracellular solute-binding protein [Treponema sp.]|nr:extracellular solute-binding protein [Treponema sp.]MCL2252018.1 extracellular solute-binding protein [Treponema sp.]